MKPILEKVHTRPHIFHLMIKEFKAMRNLISVLLITCLSSNLIYSQITKSLSENVLFTVDDYDYLSTKDTDLCFKKVRGTKYRFTTQLVYDASRYTLAYTPDSSEMILDTGAFQFEVWQIPDPDSSFLDQMLEVIYLAFKKTESYQSPHIDLSSQYFWKATDGEVYYSPDGISVMLHHTLRSGINAYFFFWHDGFVYKVYNRGIGNGTDPSNNAIYRFIYLCLEVRLGSWRINYGKTSPGPFSPKEFMKMYETGKL